ncbi:sulfotransferase family 2 domain-containing protein [Granulosicoccaceae sp. 1_MG-2023]|nr:sulfotransferase family 2 domain-containing protein [Granulosicoccaceae sp. 1_MG-2023]
MYIGLERVVYALKEFSKRFPLLRSRLKSMWVRVAPVGLRDYVKDCKPVLSDLEREHGFVFIHIPKTGGNSIRNALCPGDGVYAHFTADKYVESGVNLQRYFVFTVARNPWDRFVSAYAYLNAGGGISLDGSDLDLRFSEKYLRPYESFGDFVKALRDQPKFRRKVLAWPHFRPQYEFVYSSAGRSIVDYVAKFEKLADEYVYISKKLSLGETDGLKVINSSDRRDYRSYYDDETRQIVAELYRKDIELFGYEF